MSPTDTPSNRKSPKVKIITKLAGWILLALGILCMIISMHSSISVEIYSFADEVQLGNAMMESSKIKVDNSHRNDTGRVEMEQRLLDDSRNKAVDKNHESIREMQIENYLNGSGLMLNIHITHHGGTTLCREIGRSGPAPEKHCILPKSHPILPSRAPWKHNITGHNINLVRKSYHMISWEFGPIPRGPPQWHCTLHDTNWEHPQLLSIYITRDPISRLLAGDSWVRNNYNAENHRTKSQWSKFVDNPKNTTDNFALTRLSGLDGQCCNGESTDRKYLESAKQLLRRFTYVLDIECLDEGLQALSKQLNLPLNIESLEKAKKRRFEKQDGKRTKTAQQRINDDKIYQYLLRKNKLDIELYEWSKSISLVNCEELSLNQGRTEALKSQ